MCASNAAAARNTQIKLSRVCIVGLSDGFGHRGIQRTDFCRTVGALVRARRILAGSSPQVRGCSWPQRLSYVGWGEGLWDRFCRLWVVFDDADTRIMGEAFDAACEEVRDDGQPPLAREVMAKRIIDAARAGERDVKRLRDAALSGLKCSRGRT
jgi:hypothetical protein